VGGLLIVGLFGGYGIRFAESLALMEEDAAHQMGKMVKQRNKAIVVHSLYNSEKPHSLDLLRYYGVPVYGSLDVACKCMGVLAQYGSYLKSYHAKTNFVSTGAPRPTRRPAIIDGLPGPQCPAGGRGQAAAPAARCGGARRPPWPHRRTKPRMRPRSWRQGGPENRIAGHPAQERCQGCHAQPVRQRSGEKSLPGDRQKRPAYKSDARIEGVLVSPMVGKGIEVIIGTKIDDQFGPVIMYGLGGVLVEILKDVSFRVLPISAGRPSA
jgi:hypothetical protein